MLVIQCLETVAVYGLSSFPVVYGGRPVIRITGTSYSVEEVEISPLELLPSVFSY